jgi:hypothetical protein
MSTAPDDPLQTGERHMTKQQTEGSLVGRMMARGAVLLASSLLASSLQAAAPEPGPDPFVRLFEITCMKYYNSWDKLRTAMKESGSAELTGEAAAYFLKGKSGTAWTVPVGDQRFVVMIHGEGTCSVFARQAQVDVVQKQFTRLASRATPPVEAHSVPGGPSGGGVQTITYAWAKPAEEEQLVFTLTTSTNPAAPVQAMASMALTAKSQ